MFDSLRPHGLQHTRLSWTPLSLRICSDSCPLNQWCYLTILSSAHTPVLLLPSIFPNIRVSSNKSALHFRWPKYWSFSFGISPSNEYSGLISFRIDWFDPCCPKDSQESSPASQCKRISSLVLGLLYGPTLTPIHDYRKNHSLDYMDLCHQSDVCFLIHCLAFLPRSKCLFNFMAAVPIHSDFGAQENKICHSFHVFPSCLTRCYDLGFVNVEFQASFFMLLFHPHQEAL